MGGTSKSQAPLLPPLSSRPKPGPRAASGTPAAQGPGFRRDDDQLSSSSSSPVLISPRSSSPPRSMSLSGESSPSSTFSRSSSSSSPPRSESASSGFSFSFCTSSKGIGCFDLSTGSGYHWLPHSMHTTGSSLPRS